MGLLGDMTPEQATFLSLLGAGGLQGGFAQGGLLATQYASGAAERRAKQALTDLQLQEARNKIADEQRVRDWRGSLSSPEMQNAQTALAAGGGPTNANAAHIAPVSPLQSMMFGGMQAGAVSVPEYLKAITPEHPFGKVDPKDYTPESLQAFMASGGRDFAKLQAVRKKELGPGGQVYDPFAIAPGSTLADPNKPFFIGQNGQLNPNTPYQTYEMGKARAGATNVNVNTDKSYFGNIAEALAKNDAAMIDAARTAPDRIQTAQRVKSILTQNPITGTAAEARLGLNKAFATAGIIDGKNVADTETLASTLASQTLDAIKTSGLGSGQGFTDKDRQFLERARSGNIEMNSQTLVRLADLNENAARQSIKRGNAVIGKLRMAPQAGTMGQQLELVTEPPGMPTRTITRRGTYNGRTVIQYSDGSLEYAN